MKLEIYLGGLRYPRFGWGRCRDCGAYRLLFYATPDASMIYSPRCAPCLRLLFEHGVRPL
jgi:hypothetical protein